MLNIRIKTSLPRANSIATSRPNNHVHTRQAIREALGVIQDTWIAATMGVVLPGMSGPIRNQDYAKSVGQPQAIMLPDGGELSGAVMTNYHLARKIEEGYPQFDMKPKLLSGPKSRMMKDGRGRYVIVPFRHATPSTQASSGIFSTKMAPEIYDAIRRRKHGQSITDQTLYDIDQKRGTSHSVPRQNPTTGYQHVSPLYARLTRTGAPRHTNYYTFRTVSTNSDPDSWIVGAKPPNPVMQAVANHVRADVQRIISSGAEADLIASLGL